MSEEEMAIVELEEENPDLLQHEETCSRGVKSEHRGESDIRREQGAFGTSEAGTTEVVGGPGAAGSEETESP